MKKINPVKPFVLPPTKQALAELIKRKGEISLGEAERTLEMSRSAIREHLLHMERDGWVKHTFVRQKRGRPTIRYVLTEQGHRLFPNSEGAMLHALVLFLRQSGQDELLETFFIDYWDKRLSEVSELLGASLQSDPSEKAENLKKILEDQGFMPEYSIDGTDIEFRECNCPFSEVVKVTRLPCKLEARFFEKLWDTSLDRISYIPDGEHACTYKFNLND